MRGKVSKEMFAGIPEIDYNLGYRFFLGNSDNYTRALLSLLKSIKSKLPILQMMSLSDDYTGLRTITQTLRKMFGNIGAKGIAEITYEIEMASLNDDNLLLREQLMQYIENLIEFSSNLEEILKKLDTKNVEENQKENSSFLHYDFTKTRESIRLSSDFLERKTI